MIKVKDCLNKLFLIISQILSFSNSKRIELLLYAKVLNREKYKHSYMIGNYKGNPKYCIFRYTLPDINLLSSGIGYISNYHFCKQKGVIPLMDLEYEQVFKNNELGKYNMWDLVFEQPVSVKNAVKSDRVYVDEFYGNKTYSLMVNRKINGSGKLFDRRIYTRAENWKNYYENLNKYIKECWKINKRTEDWCEKYWSNNFKETDIILGIMLREDFSEEFNRKYKEADKALYAKHPLNPNVSEIIGIAKNKIEEWNCNTVFLSTMYYESIEIFTREFGDRIHVVPRDRRPYDISKDKRRRTAEMTVEENFELFEKNMDYFRQETMAYAYEMIILSRCHYCILPVCSGAAAVLAMNGGQFKEIEILENNRSAKGY